MESSRDDFIIAIRSAFLKKGTKQGFSLLGLILFSIIFLFLGGLNFKAIDYIKITIKEIVYRSSYIVSGPENFIKNNYLVIQNHLNLYEENEKNIAELESLKAKDLLNEFIVLENKKLKLIVDDFMVMSSEIVAKVLSDKQSPFLRSIIVNKGSKHKIKLGMIVMDSDYLVGKIVEVNYLTARVLLLSDLNSKIPVIIEPYGIQSILSGTGKNDGITQYLKVDQKIENFSVVYTSGAGGLFKAGIPVGRIKNDTEITKKKNYENVNKIDFFSDFSQLSFVKITAFKTPEVK